jgi:hypothetical protein
MIFKKIFIVASILLLVVLIFFGIYTVAFKSDETKIIKNNTEEIKGKQTDITDVLSKKIVNITSDSVVSATISNDGEVIKYYDAIDGRAWTMTERGTNQKVLSSDTTRGVPISAKWSPDSESTILKYDNGEIFVHNHVTGIDNKLRDGMDDVVWTGVGGKILYKYYDKNTKERTLNIADADGTNWKKLTDLPFQFTTFVQIPSSVRAAFWPSADAQTNTELFTVSTINESVPKKIFSDKYGADFLFSPNGQKILISSSSPDGKKIILGVMDKNGSNYIDLQVPTIIKKAVWSKDNKTVYYAQPNNVPNDVIWPNDYNEKKITTTDTFFKVDVTTGKKSRIIETDEIDEQIDAINLFLSPDEDILFFTNRVNDLLYRLKL